MNILMVCLGNICRSPLAEGIMKEKVSKYQLDAEVDSAGTAAYHSGERPDPRSIAVARKNGIDITCQRARKFKPDDFQLFDRIYAMDDSNFYDLVSMARTPEEAAKVKMIMKETHPNENRSVPDPYYGGKDGFDNVFEMLDKACEKIASDLASQP
jgi:protein-tyrosine phosphatase